MKIILNIYNENNFGNCKVDSIILTTNKMPVSFLKNIISQKYGIDKSIIILSIKISNIYFIIMSDNFPLYFYKIKENSVIYIQMMGKPEIKEEILQKVKQRENKSKYLKGLNIFQKIGNMDIIRESTLEDLDIEEEDSPKIDSGINTNENISIENNTIKIDEKNNIDDLSKIIEKRFTNAIIHNKLNELKDIMKNYNNIIDINKPIGKSKKYSPIHYASMFGYSEMLECLISKYNADINLISKDGWAPIHLCAFKGNMNILYILIKIKKIKINLCLPNIGTPLHCACKQNNIEIVSLLLSRCNPQLKNNEGLLASELAKDKNIIKLINKVIKGQNYDEKENNNKIEKTDSSINIDKGEINKDFLKKFSFLKELKNIPICPPKFVGFIFKRGKRFGKYNLRYIEINPVKDLYLRFKFREDYPFKAKEVSFLSSINSCKLMKYSEKDTLFYLELLLDDTKQIFRFESLKVCNLWIEKFNKCVEYSKFWKQLKEKYSEVPAYLKSQKPEIFEIDFSSGEIRKFEFTKEEKEKQIKELNKNEKNNNMNNNRGNEIDNSKNEKNYVNIYEFKEIIYFCNLFRIYKARYKMNGDYYLLKIFNINNLMKIKKLKIFENEIEMQKELIFPFCLSLNHDIQIEDNFYLTSEYCSGNNLSFYKNRILFEENAIKLYIAEIVLAIEYLHKLNYSYKNLCLENILIDKDNHIKLAEFQLNKIIYTYADGFRYGTGISEDIYSIGSILYELVSGIPPLFFSNANYITKKKEEELYLFNYFSDDLKDLLSKLLCKDPNKRIGFKNKKEIKNHAWFKNINWDNLLTKSSNPSTNFSLIKKEIKESFENY